MPSSCPHILTLTPDEPSGYFFLPSRSTMDLASGSQACPWVIRASKGQTITLTIYDFSFYDEAGGPKLPERSPGGHDPCDTLISVEDSGRDQVDPLKPCSTQGVRNRANQLYTSLGDQLSVYYYPPAFSTYTVNFMIQYEGQYQG